MTYDGSHGGESQSEFPEFRELPTWINFMIIDEVTPNQLPELKQSRNNGLFLEVVHSIAEVFGHFFLSHVVLQGLLPLKYFCCFLHCSLVSMSFLQDIGMTPLLLVSSTP